MKILVLGGTRFFGRRLVACLLEEGHDVTLLTRGRTADPFGSRVHRLRAARSDREQMQAAIGRSRFDVVYDQICSSPDDAALACELFTGRAGRYIFTSSMYVYPSGSSLVEADYDPLAHPLHMGTRERLGYEDGKRHAEGVFFRNRALPTVCVRLPIVMGHDDYTGRFGFHVERLLTGAPILIPVPSGRMSYISAELAARFLSRLKDVAYLGPINAACAEALTAEDVVARMSRILAREAVIVREAVWPGMDRSPYHRADDMVMATTLADRLGFSLTPLEAWFAREVERVAVPVPT